MVIMPSCTTPISSKISVIRIAIWRDMLVSCKRQRQHHGDGADLDRAVAPQQQRERAGAGDQQRVEHVEDGAEHGQQPLRGEEHARRGDRPRRAHSRPRRAARANSLTVRMLV